MVGGVPDNGVGAVDNMKALLDYNLVGLRERRRCPGAAIRMEGPQKGPAIPPSTAAEVGLSFPGSAVSGQNPTGGGMIGEVSVDGRPVDDEVEADVVFLKGTDVGPVTHGRRGWGRL